MRVALLPALILLALSPLAQAQDPATPAANPAKPLAVVKEAAKRNLPAGLATSLIGAESNFNPGARGGKAGETGLLQLMPNIAQAAGIEDTTNAREALPKMVGELSRVYVTYGQDWPLAWNFGPENMQKNPGFIPKQTKDLMERVDIGMKYLTGQPYPFMQPHTRYPLEEAAPTQTRMPSPSTEPEPMRYRGGPLFGQTYGAYSPAASEARLPSPTSSISPQTQDIRYGDTYPGEFYYQPQGPFVPQQEASNLMRALTRQYPEVMVPPTRETAVAPN